jgi:uncharacterized repeat protein (TIGR02543 family)
MRALTVFLLMMAVGGCGSSPRKCKNGTVFLTIDYVGLAASAGAVDVQVVSPSSPTGSAPTSLTRTPGSTHDTVEIDFHTYVPGQLIMIVATAYASPGSALILAQETLALPLADGCTAATITLGNSDGGVDLAPVNGPALQANPPLIDFGNVPVGGISSQRNVKITNVGTATATVSAASVTSARGFTLSDGCTGQALAPSASCAVSVVFSPTTAGATNATLTVSAGAISTTAMLTGNGVVNSGATFTVTYDGNGNTSGTAPSDSSQYTTGQIVTVLGNTGNLAKSGFVFTGWNTQTAGSGTSYSPASTFTMGAANVILYAQWSAGPTYTVTYDGNGSTGGTVPVDSTHYIQGQTVTVLGNTGNLTQSGFSFTGWNTAANGSGTSYVGSNSFNIGAANVTLYAQWSALPTYTVTYNGNGSTGGAVPVDSTHYLQGRTVTVLGNTGNLVQTGYTFSGWNTAANGSGTSYVGGNTFTMGASNVTLYAQWMLVPTYTVTYNGNGNTGGAAPTDSNHYTQGQTVTVLGVGSLTRSAYSFAGWNTQANGSGASYSAGNTFPMGTANVPLYAQWTLTPTYTVTYNGNGNTSGTVPTDSNHYTQGQTVTVLGNSGSLAKTGYSFANWNTLSDGTGTTYAQGNTFSMGSANVTLYAKWACVPKCPACSTNSSADGCGGTCSANCGTCCSGSTCVTNSCGSVCGTVCPSGQYCSVSHTSPGGTVCTGYCPTGSCCADNLTNCNGVCLDESTDPNNCGWCTNVCPSGSCNPAGGGSCCPVGTTYCAAAGGCKVNGSGCP